MLSLLLLPYLITAEQLHNQISNPDVAIIEVGKLSDYQAGHIPGAIHVDIKDLKLDAIPASGLPPKQQDLEKTFSELGITTDKHIVAYDHENGTAASRLLWLLEYTQHPNHSLLDGGMTAWKSASYEVEKTPNKSAYATYRYQPNDDVLADKESIMQNLDNPNVVILDARSFKEFAGIRSGSKRAGHIPGAIHLHYLDTIDPETKKLLPNSQLQTLLDQKGITKDKKIIVYCQTHQRASHSFAMLRHLGYQNVSGYAGSWSEWGNDPDSPIERKWLNYQ